MQLTKKIPPKGQASACPGRKKLREWNHPRSTARQNGGAPEKQIVPWGGQNAHSPSWKISTVSPFLRRPVTRLSAAPTITSSWMAESFSPFSSS